MILTLGYSWTGNELPEVGDQVYSQVGASWCRIPEKPVMPASVTLGKVYIVN